MAEEGTEDRIVYDGRHGRAGGWAVQTDFNRVPTSAYYTADPDKVDEYHLAL